MKCSCNKKGSIFVRDKCLKNVLSVLKDGGVVTLGSCCGHGKYPCTIIARVKGKPVEIFTGMVIPRKKKFYKKDAVGYYYIPEVE